MIDAEIDPAALANETLMLPNEEAWATMLASLAAQGVKRVGQVRDAAWAIRRRLLKERALSRAQTNQIPAQQDALSGV